MQAFSKYTMKELNTAYKMADNLNPIKNQIAAEIVERLQATKQAAKQ